MELETDEEVKERNKDGKLPLIIKWSATKKGEQKTQKEAENKINFSVSDNRKAASNIKTCARFQRLSVQASSVWCITMRTLQVGRRVYRKSEIEEKQHFIQQTLISCHASTQFKIKALRTSSCLLLACTGG